MCRGMHAARSFGRLSTSLSPAISFLFMASTGMLKAHAELAMNHGVAEENVFVLTDGDHLELSATGAEIIDRLPAGHVFVHGLGMWDESGNVVVERRSLARDGIVVVFSGPRARRSNKRRTEIRLSRVRSLRSVRCPFQRHQRRAFSHP